MASEKKNLICYANDFIAVAINEVYKHLYPLIDKNKLRKQVNVNTNTHLSDFAELDTKVLGGDYRKCLSSPQIYDALGSYFSYKFLLSILQLQDDHRSLKDDLITYISAVIEKYYPELSSDNSLWSVRRFIDIIDEICSKAYNDINTAFAEGSILSNQELFFSFKGEHQARTEIAYYFNSVYYLVTHEYVPKNSEYENTKRTYTKSLIQLHQYGFIYLLGEYRFNDFYIPPVLVDDFGTQNKRKQSFHPGIVSFNFHLNGWKDIFDSQNIVYIIGGAGYGKSLFLNNIINNYKSLNINNSKDYLIIYCDLKSFFTGDVSRKTLVDYFRECIISDTGLESITKEFIQYYINIGRCLFLLDALDEVPKEKRKKLHKKLISFFSTSNPSNKICITSRARGFLPEMDVTTFKIMPLTKDDIHRYIDKMITLKKFKEAEKNRFLSQAQTLIEKEFLNNFLVLSLLVNIYKAEKDLPENKIDLYKKCFEYIAKKREEEKSKTGYNWETIYPLMKESTFIHLSTLCVPNNHSVSKPVIEESLLVQYKIKYPDEASTENAIREFLEFCSNRTELFVAASSDERFKFFHRSFFEYFYSRYINQQSSVDTMYTLMSAFDIDSEVFELTVALVKEENELKYQELIKYIFLKVEEEFNTSNTYSCKCIAFGILTSAMQVIDDDYFIKSYFDLIIKYHHLMKSKTIALLNQRLISMWIEKACKNDQLRNMFLEKYCQFCIDFIIEGYLMNPHSLFYLMNKSFIREGIVKIIEVHEEYLPLHIEIDSIPFYLIVYNNHENLFEKIDSYLISDTILFDRKLDREKRKEVKKNLKIYKRTSPEERKKVFSYILKSIQYSVKR